MSYIDPSEDELPPSPKKRGRPELTPAQRALGLLVRREHSRKELTRKLTSRGVVADEAQAAVERMAAEGWQDDARFAELLIRSRAGNGHGPIRIRAELGTHAPALDVIAAAMHAPDGHWPENARNLIRRRFAAGLANFERLYAQRVDAWVLYDNSGERPVLLDWGERP